MSSATILSSVTMLCVLLKVAFERNRGGQSVDMICRELMLDEEKIQTPKRPRTKKKKGGSKAASQPVDETDASKTASSCVVRWQFVSDICCGIRLLKRDTQDYMCFQLYALFHYGLTM